jgi:hypothetical protein
VNHSAVTPTVATVTPKTAAMTETTRTDFRARWTRERRVPRCLGPGDVVSWDCECGLTRSPSVGGTRESTARRWLPRPRKPTWRGVKIGAMVRRAGLHTRNALREPCCPGGAGTAPVADLRDSALHSVISSAESPQCGKFGPSLRLARTAIGHSVQVSDREPDEDRRRPGGETPTRLVDAGRWPLRQPVEARTGRAVGRQCIP